MTATAPVPPQNLDAEESVLGAVLMSASALQAAAEVLEPEHFYRQSHALVFETANELAAAGEPVDAITVANALERKGKLSEAGGKQRIHELASIVPATGNTAHYARIVQQEHTLRQLIFAGSNIARLGYEAPGEIDELIERAEQLLSGAVKTTGATSFETPEDELTALVDDIREATRTQTPIFGLRTGLPDLDQALTGFHPGTLILAAGRPGMGKSALAQNIAENVAEAEGNVAWLTLEMSKRELLIRALARQAKIDTVVLRQGLLKQEQLQPFADAKERVENIYNKRIFVEDSPAVTASRLRAEIRRIHRQHDVQLVVVDYLQLMIPGEDLDSRQEQIAAISRSLKLLAKELQIPVLALSQLNRKLENRENKRPSLADLRDSGALEQDADVVLFLYRDDFYNPDSTDQGVAEVIVAKNRMGPSDTVRLAFVARHNTFKTIPRQENP